LQTACSKIETMAPIGTELKISAGARNP